MKKAISVFLAILMCLSIMPVAVFAAEESAEETEIEASAEDTLAAWDANYGILLETLMNGENYAHYKYVIDNNEEIRQMMDVYTAFGLYDNAWKNYFTKDANIDTCKQILMAMIEEYSVEMGDSYVDAIVDGLQTAKDAAEFVEKLNGYLSDYSDVLDFVSSQEWSTVFSVVDALIKVGNAWQDIRDGLIEAYAQIMSVQLANGYYIEMLQYVADNTDYAPMKTAAAQLINEATTAVEEQIAYFLDKSTEDLQNYGIDYLFSLALNSNVYTATAYKIFNGASSVADILWNTGDQYALFDALSASFYAEDVIDDYAAAAFDKTAENYDAARTMFAVYSLISVRSFGENSLYNLLVAQSGGIINKIKSKVYNSSFTEYTANIAALELTEEALFNTDVANMIPVEAVAYVYCPVSLMVYDGDAMLFRVADGEDVTYDSNLGMAKASYCEYNKEYIKVVFLKDEAYKLVLFGTDDGYVTFVKDVMENGVLNDYSFTEVAVTPSTKISIEGLKYTVTKDGTAAEYALSDVFVQPEGKEVTWETVTDATQEVIEEETTNFFAKIKAFFEKLFAMIKELFSFGK